MHVVVVVAYVVVENKLVVVDVNVTKLMPTVDNVGKTVVVVSLMKQIHKMLLEELDIVVVAEMAAVGLVEAEPEPLGVEVVDDGVAQLGVEHEAVVVAVGVAIPAVVAVVAVAVAVDVVPPAEHYFQMLCGQLWGL